MKLDFLVKVYNKLDEINPHIKTAIIILLIMIPVIFFTCLNMVSNYRNSLTQSHIDAEQYTIDCSTEINRIIVEIQDNVPECSNVLLLTYHNLTNSVNGFSYMYLDCLTETSRSIDDPILQDYWANLKYIYYCDELQRIHNTGYFMINNTEDVKFSLPRLYRKFKECDAQAVTILPLEGIKLPIGMIIIFYKEPQPKRNLHTQKVSKCLQQLSTLLDQHK